MTIRGKASVMAAHGSARFRCRGAGAFSLVELMVAIVILGLGLVMVATMFPVAWDRARTLTEVSTAQTVTDSAEQTLSSLVQVSGVGLRSTMLAGDLLVEPNWSTTGLIVAYSDTRVHALNMENLLVQGQQPFTGEDPWRIERLPALASQPQAGTFLWDGNLAPTAEFFSRTFHTSRVRAFQRVYPPMPARKSPSFQVADPQWDQSLSQRTFAWSALHRIRDFGAPTAPAGNPPITGPASNDPASVATAKTAASRSRTVDLYIVSLRRPSATARYARQNPQSAPNPYFLDRPAQQMVTSPQALLAAQDVLLPVPWRVQIEFPTTLNDKNTATSIPTEIQVPATGMQEPAAQLVVGMFSPGTLFVDELNGNIYRVAARRVTGGNNEVAVATLDREVLVEELDLPAGYPACDFCTPLAQSGGQLDPEELVRTVWVFPPAVIPRSATDSRVYFTGSQPVVDIEVRTLQLSPAE